MTRNIGYSLVGDTEHRFDQLLNSRSVIQKNGTRFATAKVRIVSVQYKGSNLINLLFRNPLTFSSLRVDSMTKKPLIV